MFEGFLFPRGPKGCCFMKRKNSNLTKVAITAMLSAISFVLFLFEFPVIAAFGHLKLDFSDVPAIIGGLICGPWSAVLIELVKNLIELCVKGVGTQMGFGNIMNFIVGCAYTVPFCLCYKAFSKKLKESINITLSGIIGIISIVVMGILGNYFIDPPFFKYFLGIELSKEALWSAIWAATAINAIKGVMLTFLGFPVIMALVSRIKKYVK